MVIIKGMASIKKLTDIAASLIIVYFMFLAISWGNERKQRAAPWYTVNFVKVEDHVQGSENKIIYYDRTVHYDFSADWFVKVESYSTGQTECYGNGSSRYEASDSSEKVSLEWYVGKDCKLKPGEYTLNTIWVKKSDGASIQNFSNKFTVYKKGSSDKKV